jgi:formylglycine-generating enzyme required for sulfatase activity
VAPPNQYTTISTDEVEDNYTGLIWQRAGDASGLITWDAAVAYCDGLTIGGAKWRLPSVRELSTLVDEAQVGPAINRTAFPNTKFGARSNNWYWASHHQRGSTTVSWGLNFDDGFTGFNSASAAWNTFGPSYAKCVR